MKKSIFITLLAIFMLPFITIAHAPKTIKAEYNSETGVLKVDIPHKVKNVTTHYIDEIVITVNEVETKTTYTEQSSKESHVAEITLDKYEKGTTISIYASCNKLGSKKAEIIVE